MRDMIAYCGLDCEKCDAYLATINDDQALREQIEICGSAASSHPKGAFQIRNRQMVKRSNLVVFYVDHTGGGAYQTMRYAQKEKKNILNLAGEGYGEKE